MAPSPSPPPHAQHAPDALRGWRVVAGWGGAGVLLAGVVLGSFLLLGEEVEAAVRGVLASPPPRWQLALGLGALLAGDVLLPVPSSLVSTAAGALLGVGAGTATVWTGMMLGAWLGYRLGARAGDAVLRRMAGAGQVAQVARAVERLGPWALLLLRGVPVLAEVSVVLAGASRLPARPFLLSCALANLGLSLTYVGAGALAAAHTSLPLLLAGTVLLPGGALLLARRLGRGAPGAGQRPQKSRW